MRSRFATFAVATATAAATTAIFAGTALADPPAGYSPTITDRAGVGSDTTELVMNALTWGQDAPTTNPPTSGFNSTVAQTAGWYDSWNATGSATIATKPGCPTVNRADGSSAGISALVNSGVSTVDNVTPCIDYARSSRGPKADGTDVDKNGNPLFFEPFAQDVLQYASSAPTTSFPSVPATNAPQNLTVAQLKTIYTTVGITWTAVGGTSTDVIQKVIPQAGSGTRSFFEGQLGITDAQLASDVITVQEHDPAPIRANADRVGPFSDARFTHVDSDQGIQLDGPVTAPTGFTATREIYNVVKLDPNTLQIPAYLQALFGDGSGTVSTGSNWICSSAAQTIITSEGFINLPNGTNAGDCGVAEHNP